MTFHALVGIAAGILAFAANPVYVIDILKGNTKPSKVTWWVLALLNGMLAVSYYASGARDTIWIPVAYTVSFSIIAILSIRYGEGGWTRIDIFCLAGAFASALVWLLLKSPVLALYVIIAIDFFGLFPTIYKSYKRPWTEDRNAWFIATVAAFFNILAIETWTLPVGAYPFYVFITNILITCFILFPRTVK